MHKLTASSFTHSFVEERLDTIRLWSSRAMCARKATCRLDNREQMALGARSLTSSRIGRDKPRIWIMVWGDTCPWLSLLSPSDLSWQPGRDCCCFEDTAREVSGHTPGLGPQPATVAHGLGRCLRHTQSAGVGTE